MSEPVHTGLSNFVRDDLHIWKTIEIGTEFKTLDDFRSAFKKAGIGIGNWGSYILDKLDFTTDEMETELDLVRVFVESLGFKYGGSWKEVYTEALDLGLLLCPAEVGPQLRIQYMDQPQTLWPKHPTGEIYLGMMPIYHEKAGCEVVFHITHDRIGGYYNRSGLWIDARGSASDHDGMLFLSSRMEVVFVKPRQ